ncbi:MAG TPA: ferredoxin--NADP reductase [Gallionella sp.]|nr:ferredoxin--NADP reductase [Gallionella sp.]
MKKLVKGTLVAKHYWTDSLISLQIEAPEVTFFAGQFGRLALPAPPGSKEEMIGRPYSFVNSPHVSPHEFYFVVVPEGPLTSRLAALAPGDPVWLLPSGNGFFIISEVPKADVLWCLSTGTGLGPFLSILGTAAAWEKFSRIVLVHAVRFASDLSYGDTIAEIAATHPDAFVYIPMVSREAHGNALGGRIPNAIRDGQLEARAGLTLQAENSHVMLCGNPAMVEDTQKVLEARGMKRHRRTEPGHFTVETYW